MRRGKPTGIGDIIAGLKKKTALGKQLDQAEVWEHWPDVIGAPLWMHTKPVKFRDKKLYVEADAPVWSHEFALRKWDIIGRINRLAGYELVSDLFVSLSPEIGRGRPQDKG